MYVVGIGASAGGLEALRPLLANLPRTGRLAFVIAQHMAADAHAELMVGLLQRDSSLEVALATDGAALEPDRVYFLPAGRDGVVFDQSVRLREPAPHSLSRPSVDVLLESLAEAFGSQAVGIVVSGTGSDGTRGCRAIRARGGLTLAQTAETARYAGMPEAAVRAGTIAESLPVQSMGERLARIFAPWPVRAPSPPPPTVPLDDGGLAGVLDLVREASGVDFSVYKDETLLRRMGGRAASLGLDSVEAYPRYLSTHPAEAETLAQHFLVSMSSFFRDRSSFGAVEAALRGRQRLRVWVPGCASGEECFTLAILAARAGATDVQIVGTDLNPRALAVAERGEYPESAFKEVERDIRERWFYRKGSSWQVNELLQKMCIFAQKDVFGDAPARDLDMISCRNLLIYLRSDAQARLLLGFHAALRAGGLLFIGQSETIGASGGALFRTLDAEHKLYERRTA